MYAPVQGPSPRILICRLSAIGDCVQTMPVLCALRARFPDAFLAWAVQERCAPLLEGHPCLDYLIRVPGRWSSLWRDSPRVVRTLRSLHFDIAVDPQSLSKSAVVARLSGAPRRIGFARPQGRELSPLLNTERVRPTASHVVDRYLELLTPLGVSVPEVRFLMPEDAASAAFAETFLRSLDLRSFAVLNPGAGWDSRLWLPERYAEVAKHLGGRHGLRSIVTWAGAREYEWAQMIAGGAGGQAVLAPTTSLLELTALLREAALFVGSDTGPLHLAAAVGTPCVGLHGPTLPERSGAYGEGHVSVQELYHTGLNPRRRWAGNAAMRAIQTDRVCRACDEALARVGGDTIRYGRSRSASEVRP